jgi:hypothetical protein
MSIGKRQEAIDGTIENDGIGIQQEQVFATRLDRGQVVRTAKPKVRFGPYQPHAGELGSDGIGGTVG